MKTVADYTATQELYIFAENDYDTYFSSLTPTMDNMDKKRQRGTFRADLATKAFEHCAEYAARRYTRMFGGVWCQVFNAATRRAVAALLLDRYQADTL